MSHKKTLIPKAGVIEVPDPPLISPVEFIQQVIANINAQLEPLDTEVAKARVGDVAHVRILPSSPPMNPSLIPSFPFSLNRSKLFMIAYMK